jgi:D-cysteine desulfhydrase
MIILLDISAEKRERPQMNLSKYPRRRYTLYRTPIEELPRFSSALGGPKIYIKRDDLLGLAGGGNKTRKLEFLISSSPSP